MRKAYTHTNIVCMNGELAFSGLFAGRSIVYMS
jgi:hypothetical protein